MDGLLSKIYERIISEESGTYEGRKRVEACVEKLLQKHAANFGQEETEAVRVIAYAAACQAEQEGFRSGIRFAVELYLEFMGASSVMSR